MSRSQFSHRPSAAGSARSRQPSHAHSQPHPQSQPQPRSGSDDADRERRGGGHNGGSTKHIPCKFFKHGNCTAGADCSFSHDINSFVEKAVCKYFVKGNCKYGSKCALLHIGQHENSSRQPHSHAGGSRVPHGSVSGSASSVHSNGHSGSSPKNGHRAGSTLSGSNGTGSGGERGGAATSVAGYDSTHNSTPTGSIPAHARRASPLAWAAALPSPSLANSSGADGPGTEALAAGPSSSFAPKAKARAHIKSSSSASSGRNGGGQSTGLSASDEDAVDSSAGGIWVTGRADAAAASRKDSLQKTQVFSGMLNKEHASRTDSGVAEFASISSHHDPLLGDSQQGQWRGQNHYRLSLLDGEPLDSSLFSRQPDSSPISLLTAQLVREGISEDGQGPRSQPIPKPAIGSKHSYRDSFMSTTVGGLSLQDSLRIETLAMSQSAAHQSFSGSPFLSGSIPLLDQFRENSRLDVGMGSGNSPPAHSLARSPPASASGFGLMRHAFTNVDSTISTPGGQDMEMGGSFQSIYHNQLHGISGSSAALDAQGSATGNGYHEANPVGAVRSIPRATDVLSRSLRSSSLVGDSRGPLTSLMSADFADHSIAHPLLSTSLASPVSAGGASTLPGRVRSNTQIPPASLLQFSSGLELSSSASHAPVRSPTSARDGHAGGGFPLQADLHSVPNDSAMAFAPGVWDSHALSPTSETSQEHSQKAHDPLSGHRPPLGGLSLASQRTSTSFTSINNMHHYPQHQQQQQQQQQQQKSQAFRGPQLWATSPAVSSQASNQSSPFSAAISGGFGGSRQFASPQLAPGAPTSDGFGPGGLGQRLSRPQNRALGIPAGTSQDYANAIQAGAANRGSGSSASASNVTGRSSANGSSAASDHDGEMFELEPEPEMATQPRLNGDHSLIPNPDLIFMQGFTRKISGLSLDRIDSAGVGAARAVDIARPLPEVSAIARPSKH